MDDYQLITWLESKQSHPIIPLKSQIIISSVLQSTAHTLEKTHAPMKATSPKCEHVVWHGQNTLVKLRFVNSVLKEEVRATFIPLDSLALAIIRTHFFYWDNG